MATTIKPLNAPLGAQVFDFDPLNISDQQRKELVNAWLQYQVLLIRHGQILEDEDFLAFGRLFGGITPPTVKSPLTRLPEIMVVSNIRKDGKALGRLPDGEMALHFDMMYHQIPNKGGILHAVKIPQQGGDTLFTNMYNAFETLPDRLKKRILGLHAVNTYSYGAVNSNSKKINADTPTATQPVVRTIPETGRQALYVSRLMTDSIVGLEEQESRRLLEELWAHAEQSRFVYRHQWQVGDILLWDNRCTAHARTDFSNAEPRMLKRLTISDVVAPS